MTKRYFVEILAEDNLKLRRLQKMDLDVFQPSAKSLNNEKKEVSIEGLVTIEEINQLIQNGYKVLIKKEAPSQTPAVEEMVSFQDWKKSAEKETVRAEKIMADKGDLQETGEKEKEGAKASAEETMPSAFFPGYLTSDGIESALQYIASIYPQITELVTLPEKTHEGRTSRLIKIGKKHDTPRNGVLLLGGVHAREILNPDLLVKLSLSLCNAYTSGTGLTFGGKPFTSEDVKRLVDGTELYILPLVNPDGRAHVQAPNGDVWWRKNRNPNPGLPFMGVDLNRNYDFLWDSGIGTSTNSGSDIYRGKSPNSEPETRNVVEVLNKNQDIICVIDVHSYQQTILYPWGDDDNQTVDPDMNFKNPGYDGGRGLLGDSDYLEYIHKADLDQHVELGNKIKDAISTCRNTEYKVEQSVSLYPTSGTCHDYVYSLRYKGVDRSIMGYTIETATRFQPDYSEGVKVMNEVSTGLIEACLVFSRTMNP
jgi:carboxypeptidase T